MSRGLTVAQLAAIDAHTVKPGIFVYLDWRSVAVRAWSGIGDFVWDGNTYSGVGTFGGISVIEETGNPVANGITLSLSGIPSDLIATALDRTEYRGRKVRVWQALFNVSLATPTLIDDPFPIFAGRMDVMTPTDTGVTSTITLSCENRLIDLSRPRERRYTDQDQRQLHPGDGSFRYVAGMQDKQFNWGIAGSTSSAPIPSLGGRTVL